MNAHVSISFADQLSARYKLARTRTVHAAPKTRAKPETAPQVKSVARRPVFVEARPLINHNHHMQAYHAWRAMTGAPMPAREYLKAMCFIAGITVETLQSRCRQRWIIPIRRAIIRSVAIRYPHLSSNQMEPLFKLEHTTILFHIGATVMARSQGTTPLRERKKFGARISDEVRQEAIRLHATGMSNAKIGALLGISHTSVGSIAHRAKKKVNDAKRVDG